MKAQPDRYFFSRAPTGRARCRACKGLVAKGSARLVTLAVVSMYPRRVVSLVRHATCVDAAFGQRVLKVGGGGVDQVPGFGTLEAEEAVVVRGRVEAVKT